jgi:hypothetical protein
MKLHASLVEKLIRLFTTYGGYREDTRLRNELNKLEVSTYERQTGEQILVEKQELDRKKLDV